MQLLRSKNVPESGLAVKYFLQHLAIKEGLTEGEVSGRYSNSTLHSHLNPISLDVHVGMSC